MFNQSMPSPAAKSKRRQRRVLLALGWYDHRLHAGIARFAVEHGWHLCPDTTKEKVIPWGWEGDGILAWLGAGDDLADFVAQARKPTVDFSFRRAHLPFARALVDHAAIGRLVADHFLSRGLRHFAFYCDTPNWATAEKERAFINHLEVAGQICHRLHWHESNAFTTGRLQWKHKRNWLARELKHLPHPIGILATTDDQAVEVLEVCESLGLSVPEQISLIGVDNSLPAADAMHTPLSSVDTDLEQLGYRGAALLQSLMDGRPAPKEPLRVPPRGLVARKSSDLIAVKHEGVARSLRFLWEHCHEPIGVEDLARAAAMSRRSLHQAFIDQLGRPPGAELHRVRIERARKLLLDTDDKLESIAEQCGYQSANSLWVAFKQATGFSPKQFRDENRS
jgi:LacI family transcriptional regulator